MLYSENHLRAEADYRREVLRRRVPPTAPQVFELDRPNRSRYSGGDKGSPMAGMLSTLGRVVRTAKFAVKRLKEVRHA